MGNAMNRATLNECWLAKTLGITSAKSRIRNVTAMTCIKKAAMGLKVKSSSFLAIISEISTMPMLNRLFAISMVASKRCGLLYTCNMILSREEEDLVSSSLFRGEREKNATSDAAINADKQRRTTVHIKAKGKLI